MNSKVILISAQMPLRKISQNLQEISHVKCMLVTNTVQK